MTIIQWSQWILTVKHLLYLVCCLWACPEYSSMTLETKKGANQGEFSVGYREEHESFQDTLPHFPKWLLKNKAHLQFFICHICMCWVFIITCLSFGVPDLLLQVDSGAIGYFPGLSKAQNIHRHPQPLWTAGSHSRLAEGLWHGQPVPWVPNVQVVCIEGLKPMSWAVLVANWMDLLKAAHPILCVAVAAEGRIAKFEERVSIDVFLLMQDNGDLQSILTYTVLNCSFQGIGLW